MDPFIGEIRLFAGTFAPVGWALCDGQLIAIAQNEALFSLLGTTYGGDGVSTYALPDFRGRVPLHQGSGPLGNYVLGERAGTETVTLTGGQLPNHSHTAGASAAAPAAVPAGGINLASTAMVTGSPLPKPKMYADPATLVAMSPNAIAAAGGSLAHNNMAPNLALNFIIAMQGIFPSRG